MHERVIPAIVEQGYRPIQFVVSNKPDEMTYARFVRCLSYFRHSACIVEPDIESRPGFLQSLDECPEPWCFYDYPGLPVGRPWTENFAHLGHARFRMKKVGQFLIRGLEEFSENPVTVAFAVNMILLRAGFSAHRHEGMAFHHFYAG